LTTGQFTSPPQHSNGDQQDAGDQPGTPDQESTQPFAEQAQERAQELGGQAQQKVREAATEAKGQLREQLDQRSSQVAEQINEQASDLRAVSEALRQQGKDGPARAAEKLAEYVHKAGSYLQEKDSGALLSDIEGLGRRQPLAAGAGALALGFAASRFLKASSSKRYSDQARTQAPAYPGAGVSHAPISGAPEISPATPGWGVAAPPASPFDGTSEVSDGAGPAA